MNKKLSKTNQSVEKVFQIIEIMAKNKSPMRLLDISASAEIPTSTTLRLVNTLMTYGYVYQNSDTLRYSLTLKFSQIGALVSSQINIRDIVRPFLVELSAKCKTAACLAIEDDMEVVYIDTVDGPESMLKIMQRIGKRAPLYCSGVGKAFLLNYTRDELETYITKTQFIPFTEHTITSKEELLRELDKIVERNYSIDNEECELGARCIAAPIRDYTGKIIACISISGPVSVMSMENIEVLKVHVIETAKLISNQLSYDQS